MPEHKIKIGIIGGSGFDDPKLLDDYQEIKINTPFGLPSSAIKMGKLGKARVVIIARHCHNHSIMPTKVSYRANIWTLK